MMKRYILVILFAIFGLATYSQTPDTVTTPTSGTSNDALWEKANQAFISGQYPLAVADYQTILQSGVQSAELYYNLGNAYFQQNQIGKAILNYTRASNLDPSDEDIQYNLQMAKARSKDKIEPVPQFFIKRWTLAIGNLLSSNSWTMLALFSALISMVSVLLWLISGRLSLRKLGFFTALIFMILFVASMSYSQINAWKQYDTQGAIIMNTAAPVKSSPASGGKDLFVLHEGTYAKIMQQLDGWSEISLEDGNKGWISSDAIERISN